MHGLPVEGSKTLLALTATSAAVKDTVGAGGVPAHADKETTVVSEIRGPPVLGVGHEVVEVLFEGIVVEGLEGGGIVKVWAEGVVGGVVLAEDVELDGVGPPAIICENWCKEDEGSMMVFSGSSSSSLLTSQGSFCQCRQCAQRGTFQRVGTFSCEGSDRLWKYLSCGRRQA